MPKVKTVLNPKSYSVTEIDLILIGAMGLTACEEVLTDVSFEWLLEHSQSSLEDLA